MTDLPDNVRSKPNDPVRAEAEAAVRNAVLIADPSNPYNVKCWVGSLGTVEFTPHLDLTAQHPDESFVMGGYTFDRRDIAEGIQRMQDSHGVLQEKVWEVEDDA